MYIFEFVLLCNPCPWIFVIARRRGLWSILEDWRLSWVSITSCFCCIASLEVCRHACEPLTKLSHSTFRLPLQCTAICCITFTTCRWLSVLCLESVGETVLSNSFLVLKVDNSDPLLRVAHWLSNWRRTRNPNGKMNEELSLFRDLSPNYYA